MTFDGKAFGQEIVGVVKNYVRDAIAPVLVRLDAIEKRQPEKGERGEKGDKGEPGQDGVDGADGIGFDDLEVVHDGLRTFTFRFAKGEKMKEFPFTLPVVLDRGVFKAGDTYSAGDGVTWGGSFWIAQKDTADKPGDGDGWRLAVKKGRDGKDGIMKTDQPKQPLKVG
ncbi:collagen triple helix repeat-containing protein [Nitratireductor indicus C115]|uniref:Collagen triple helix repeat-containing protein n=1 Tax=Nitratireductor indicus C115 TaxID=1231190 RepID=K2MXE7_9HYPH|nr:collagen-like triple helix repeat-containing protein [Nitratireductor indicus]EKF39928.1 collagen triple helix repeat-containing protein [Nitratireductor indicus C115]SFQ82038.1 hypothetical protein SAMN05216176_1274 [Nitratireductor indicus]